jgi:hypothetical protein
MKKLHMVLFLVFLVCISFACQKGEEMAEEPVVDVKALSDEDAVEIKKTFQGFIQACLDGNWDLAVTYYAENATNMPFNAPMEKGREVYRI